jgi:CRP-like cAMP-binding protein
MVNYGKELMANVDIDARGSAKKFTRVYGKSEVIFEENSPGDEMFVVCSGRVSLLTEATGEKVVIGTVHPGECFGEMALIDTGPRSATAIAEDEGTTLVVLDQAKFLYLVSQQPPFALTVMNTLCQRIRETWGLYSRSRHMEKPFNKSQTPSD